MSVFDIDLFDVPGKICDSHRVTPQGLLVFESAEEINIYDWYDVTYWCNREGVYSIEFRAPAHFWIDDVDFTPVSIKARRVYIHGNASCKKLNLNVDNLYVEDNARFLCSYINSLNLYVSSSPIFEETRCSAHNLKLNETATKIPERVNFNRIYWKGTYINDLTYNDIFPQLNLTKVHECI